MPTAVPTLPFSRRLAALGAAWLLLGAGASAAQAGTAGTLPPSNPAGNCSAGRVGLGLGTINACRAQEGLGPLRLPRNWSSLGPVDQGFVLLDLERVNRGLAPIVGLSPALDQLAAAGARAGGDPAFPANGAYSGGAIWAGVPSVLAADQIWMYGDGPGGGNLACAAAGQPGCWGHRTIILWDRTSRPLVAGGGFATAGGSPSLAYVVLSGYSTAHLAFSWAGELRYFATPPGLEPLERTAVARPSGTPRHRQVRPRRRHRSHHHRSHRHRRHRPSQGAAPSQLAADAGPTISLG